MPTVYYFVGPTCSGKSTYAKQLNGTIVSSDSIREELGQVHYDPSQNEKVFDILKQRVIETLKTGGDVIFDATNLFRYQRKHDIRVIREAVPDVKVIGIVFNIEEEEAIKRMSTRSENDINHVTIDVFRRHKKTLLNQPPKMNDGFDDIVYI